MLSMATMALRELITEAILPNSRQLGRLLAAAPAALVVIDPMSNCVALARRMGWDGVSAVSMLNFAELRWFSGQFEPAPTLDDDAARSIVVLLQDRAALLTYHQTQGLELVCEGVAMHLELGRTSGVFSISKQDHAAALPAVSLLHPPLRKTVGRLGLEPRTYGLKVRSSTD